MPVPSEYQQARDQFYALLEDARDFADLETTNQAYTMLQGVLQTFRRRLTLREGIAFAQALPPIARAIFVSDWNTEQAIVPFADLETMTKEVQSLRPDHNDSPQNAIPAVARAMRIHSDNRHFDQVLSSLSSEARDFWDPGPDADREIEKRTKERARIRESNTIRFNTTGTRFR